jgi:hypothetical protein
MRKYAAGTLVMVAVLLVVVAGARGQSALLKLPDASQRA